MSVKVRDAGLSLDQDFLLPVSIRDWLPKDHLAFFVVDAVSQLDLSTFDQGRRVDGWGGASYDPRSMVGVIMYGYMTGVVSSRQLENRCHDSMAFRVAGRGITPDHTTIARFRAGHEQGFISVFTQVLGLCHRAGLVDMSLIAVDGTKIGANASPAQSRTAEELAAMLIAAAEQADTVDDEQEQASPPAPPPDPGLAIPGPDRIRRIKQALTDLDREHAEAEQAHAHVEAEQAARLADGKPVMGRPARDSVVESRQRANITDPDSRIMRTAQHTFIPGYNAQIAVVASQVVVAADVFQNGNDFRLLAPMIDQTRDNYQHVSATPAGPLTVVADAGYYTADNAQIDQTTTWIPAGNQSTPGHNVDQVAAQRIREHTAAHRYNTGVVDGRHASIEAGVSHPRFYRLAADLKNNNDHISPRDAMDLRMATPEGKTLYRRRCVMVEPVFAHIKHNLGIRHFLQRGLHAVKQEFLIIVTAGNLLKAWRAA